MPNVARCLVRTALSCASVRSVTMYLFAKIVGMPPIRPAVEVSAAFVTNVGDLRGAPSAMSISVLTVCLSQHAVDVQRVIVPRLSADKTLRDVQSSTTFAMAPFVMAAKDLITAAAVSKASVRCTIGLLSVMSARCATVAPVTIQSGAIFVEKHALRIVRVFTKAALKEQNFLEVTNICRFLL